MVDLIRGLRAADVRANLERVRDGLASAGREPESLQILAAVKYLAPESLSALAEGGITLVGENRAQALLEKQEACRDRFTWDFIGALQSRKVRQLLGRVRYIHSVASDSALRELACRDAGGTEILVEVNVAGEPGKAGVEPSELAGFLERAPVPVVGLMTMPPLADRPEINRRHFAALRELAEAHGLRELSMGTSQDYVVAAQEGATIIRLGSTLFAPGAP